METIDIALASDARYLPGLLVTACSIARHASREFSLRFNILDGGIGADGMKLLENRLSCEHPAVELRVHDVDEARFSRFAAWHGRGRMTYARLLLPEMVEDAEFMIYCDVDFLWQSDVAELWKLRDRDRIMQAVADGQFDVHHPDSVWFREHGLTVRPSEYVCCGLMMINLEVLRRTGAFESVLEFLGDHPDLPFVDQTAINAVVDDIGRIPSTWAAYSSELPKGKVGIPNAIHFGGDAPWQRHWWDHAIFPAWMAWHEFYGGLSGIGALDSLRRIYSPGEIIVRRTVLFLVTHAVTRGMFFFFLRITRRECYIGSLRRMARRYVD